MIYVIHGTDIVASRKRLSELRGVYSPDAVQSLISKDIVYSQFSLLFSTMSMFGEKRVVVVEGKLDGKLVDVQQIVNSDVDLVVWVGEKLRANDGLLTLVKDAKGQVDYFEEKADLTIFPFLDAVVSRNRRAALVEYMKLMKLKSEPIYLLTMLVWQFRNLIVPENASGFVQKKALEAKNRFTFEELRKIYYQLLQMDIAMKTGSGVPEVLLEQFILKVTK
jgi:DNA polymerase III delta subunit